MVDNRKLARPVLVLVDGWQISATRTVGGLAIVPPTRLLLPPIAGAARNAGSVVLAASYTLKTILLAQSADPEGLRNRQRAERSCTSGQQDQAVSPVLRPSRTRQAELNWQSYGRRCKEVNASS